MDFKNFKKEFKGIKLKSNSDWEIFLPYSTKTEEVQSIVGICRKHLIVDWHIIFSEPTDENPEPDIRMYWDRKTSKEVDNE